MFGLIVPPANGSPCRGNENQPSGPPAGDLGDDFGRARDPIALVVTLQGTHILVLEAVGGDLMALGDEGANLVGIDMREHRRDGEGRLEVVAL